jgi:uncharacterized membrane protein YdbT with pleckstrin-like domain
MGFPRKLLNQDEEIVLDLRPHWIFLAPTLAILVAVVFVDLLIASLLDFRFDTWWREAVLAVLLLALIAALGLFLHRYGKWVTTQFVVTNQRLIAGRGVISKRRKEIPLDRINDVSYHQRVIERMVGAGNITVESAGEHGRERFTDIVHPDAVQQHIYAQMERHQARFQTPYAQQPPGSATAPVQQGAPVPSASERTQPVQSQPAATQPVYDRGATSIPEQIEQLHDLYQRGLLTQAEYDAKKAELLDRM